MAREQVAVAAVADVHVGNHAGARGGAYEAGINARCRAVLTTLETAVHAACQAGASYFVVLGDLLDVVKPEPQVLTAVQRIFEGTLMDVVLLLGNHEMVSTAQGDHALGPLRALERVAVVERPTVWRRPAAPPLALVPYQPGDASRWLPGVLTDLAAPEGSVLCVHMGVIHKGTPDYLIAAHDAAPEELLRDLAAEHGFPLVLAGNWHERYVTRVAGAATVAQVGALCPTGWDNPGFDDYGGLALVSKRGELVSMGTVPGPRFVKVHTKAALSDAVARAQREGCGLYARVVVPPAALAGGQAWAAEIGNADGVRAVEVLPDGEMAKAAAHAAAAHARSADSTDDAVRKYVGRMSLAQPVDPGVVVERALGYLRRA